VRRISNPPDPWTSRSIEWLEEPPPAPLEVFEERARSLLTRNDSPDVPFRWGANPYRGCQHGCAYCYAVRSRDLAKRRFAAHDPEGEFLFPPKGR